MTRSQALLLLMAGLALGVYFLARGGGADAQRVVPGQEGREDSPQSLTQEALPGPRELEGPEASTGARAESRLNPSSSRRSAEEAEPEGPLTLSVQTVESTWLAETGEVPNVPFVLVRDPDRVEPEVLLRGQTDARGKYQLELDPDEPLARALTGGRTISAHAESGFQRRSAEIEHDGEDPRAYRVAIPAVPGLTVRGEVRNAEDQRTMARVWVRFPGMESAPEPDRWDFQAYSQRGGLFQLHLKEGGVGDLVAEGGQEGVGSIRNLGMTVNGPPPHQVIRLEGPGLLQGRITNAAGEPVPDLPLYVQLEALDDGSGRASGQSLRHEPYLLEGRGRPAAALTTNREGKFLGTAMHNGAYTIRARLPGRDGAYPLLLSSAARTANGAFHELRFTRPHLVVRLRDADGGPWSGGEVRTARVPVSGGQEGLGWRTHTQLIVVPVAEGEGTSRTTGSFLQGREVARGEFMFELDQGADYLVGATGPGFGGELQSLHAPATSDRHDLELTASAGLVLGRLRVVTELPRPAGQGQRSYEVSGRTNLQGNLPFTEEPDSAQMFLDQWMSRGRLSMQLVEGPSGLPILDWIGRSSAEGQLVQAPEGSYLLEAEMHGAETAFGSPQTPVPVQVVGGEEREVRVRLAPYSILEVTLSGSSGPQEAGSPEEPQAGELGASEPVTLELVDARGVRAILPRRLVGRMWDWTEDFPAESWWPMGETHHTFGLPPGTYELIATRKGGTKRQMEVLLLGGEVTRVHVQF